MYNRKGMVRRRVKPRRSSWHTRRRFRIAEGYDAVLMQRRLLGLADVYAGTLEFEGKDRIYLPDDLYDALLTVLEKVTLPFARYEQWCCHGENNGLDTLLEGALSNGRICDDRCEIVARALMAIEPFPSKKEVDRFMISKVLADAGNIWPAYRERDHRG